MEKGCLHINQGLPMWLVLFKLFSGKDFGYSISFDEITSKTGIVRKQVYPLIPLVNESLANQDKVLRNVMGKGYRVASLYELQECKRKGKIREMNHEQSNRHLHLLPPIRRKELHSSLINSRIRSERHFIK